MLKLTDSNEGGHTVTMYERPDAIKVYQRIDGDGVFTNEFIEVFAGGVGTRHEASERNVDAVRVWEAEWRSRSRRI